MLKLSGNIDCHVQEIVMKLIKEHSTDCGCVDIDLADVKFIDSTGISILLHAVKHAKSTDCVKLYNVPQHIKKVLHTLGVDRIFTIVREQGCTT